MLKEMNLNGSSCEKQLEKKEGGVFDGIIIMGVATVWFVGGLYFGYIFFFPPILFLIGVYTVIKGLIDGYTNGKKKSTITYNKN
jgi:Sec-independent protein secretion pathway component TatC